MILPRLLSRTPALRNVAVHRDLYLGQLARRGSRPIVLVYGNCQAEALRRILITHKEFAAGYQLLRVPAVQDISGRELFLLQRLLPRVQILISQEIKPDYRQMRLGTEQIIAGLPPSAQVLRYPVAYFEGVFPFHVYVNRGANPLATSAPISDYHDLRIMHAASRGWSAATTTRWLAELEPDAGWVRRNAERSLHLLDRREAQMAAQLTAVIRDSDHLTTGFNTINHPANALVTELARQLLQHLGYPDADSVLGSQQTYLDHLKAPREPGILRALGAEPGPDDRDLWSNPTGAFTQAEVTAAHLELYAHDPELLGFGLRKHQERLSELAPMFG
jgi:Polysaccharide biosynthesis enzyme WcbI